MGRKRKTIYHLDENLKVLAKYESLTVASNATGISISHIHDANQRCFMTRLGYFTECLKSFKPKKEVLNENLFVYLLDDELNVIAEYKTQKEAAEKLNIKPGTVNRAIKSKYLTKFGYITKNPETFQKPSELGLKTNTRGCKLTFANGSVEEFNKVKDAAAFLNMTSNNFNQHLFFQFDGEKMVMKDGTVFEYID